MSSRALMSLKAVSVSVALSLPPPPLAKRIRVAASISMSPASAPPPDAKFARLPGVPPAATEPAASTEPAAPPVAMVTFVPVFKIASMSSSRIVFTPVTVPEPAAAEIVMLSGSSKSEPDSVAPARSTSMPAMFRV